MSETTDKKVQSVRGTITKISSINTVRVESKVTKVHPIYRKRYTLTRHYVAHDPKGSAQVGEEVTIVSCRPISKQKHWVIQ